MTDEEKRYRLQAIFNDPKSSGLERLNASALLSHMDEQAEPVIEVAPFDPWSDLEARANFAVLFVSKETGVPITPTGLNLGLQSVRELLKENGWSGIRPDIREAWDEQQAQAD